jgi:hypothetical protein
VDVNEVLAVAVLEGLAVARLDQLGVLERGRKESGGARAIVPGSLSNATSASRPT